MAKEPDKAQEPTVASSSGVADAKAAKKPAKQTTRKTAEKAQATAQKKAPAARKRPATKAARAEGAPAGPVDAAAAKDPPKDAAKDQATKPAAKTADGKTVDKKTGGARKAAKKKEPTGKPTPASAGHATVSKSTAAAAVPAKAKEKPALQVVRTTDDLNAATEAWRRKGETLALVPTMGALHAGHEALVGKARAIADHVVVSIFVNPTQFAPHEDLERYPRNETKDVEILDQHGVDLVWAPAVETMYPEGFTTHVAPGSAAKGLESDFRPHFFAGVATVVAKLFNQVRPRYAVFGEKDYQQLVVVTQLARDLDMGLEVVAVPTVREDDGLAMSSRNAYLNPRQRAVASNLNLVLNEVAHAAAAGASTSHLKAAAQVRLLTLGFSKVDYVEIRDAATLEPYDVDRGRPGRVLGAAWLGRTRLIDNVEVSL